MVCNYVCLYLIVDKLSATAFSPVKNDLLGNVKVCAILYFIFFVHNSSIELAKNVEKWNIAVSKNEFNCWAFGVLQKIEMKWKTDPRGLSTLQKLVDYEIRNKQHLDPNSATQALLWLTRYGNATCQVTQDEDFNISHGNQDISA